MIIDYAIEFQKIDSYDNSIFVVSNTLENENPVCRILKSQNLSTCLPIYATKDYASIRFKRIINSNSIKGVYVIRKKEHEGKEYVSCFINKSKLVKKGEAVDHGVILKLE